MIMLARTNESLKNGDIEGKANVIIVAQTTARGFERLLVARDLESDRYQRHRVHDVPIHP